MPDADRIKALSAYIETEFLGNEEELTPETPLLELGILDSMSTLSLFAFIEERFDVELGGSDMTPEHLTNLYAIDAMIERRKRAGQDAAHA
jgi:acyl carrier protein